VVYGGKYYVIDTFRRGGGVTVKNYSQNQFST